MVEIVFRPPNRDDPGYLRRQRDALRLGELLRNGELSPRVIDQLIEFLLPYVREPEDRELAREALLDASERQFMEMLRAVQGNADDAGEPPFAFKSTA